MKDTHTPGKWNIMPSMRSSLLHIETDADCPAGAGIPICSIPGNNLPNALLIASAPDLLEACRDAFMQFEHNGDESPEDKAVLDKLQIAITKAGGAQ